MREIPLEDIESITLSENSSEFILHNFEEEDERFTTLNNRGRIVEMLLYLKSKECSLEGDDEKIPIYFVKEINLDIYVTTVEDLEDGHTIRPEDDDMKMMDY